jgi:hypothetical protein
MKHSCALAFFLILSFADISGQSIPSSLAIRLKLMNVAFSPPAQYVITPSNRDFGERICEDIKCPLWKIAIVDAELIHHDEQCRVYAYVAGADVIEYGKIVGDHPELFGAVDPTDDMSYNRIKSNFKYGRPLVAASRQDIEDLKMMLHFYAKEDAQLFFNADYMAAYPYNMEGKSCKNDLTRARAIVFGKAGLNIFLYFVMTDVGMKDFGKYFADFKGSFWFKDE